jgi:hypothetical protein
MSSPDSGRKIIVSYTDVHEANKRVDVCVTDVEELVRMLFDIQQRSSETGCYAGVNMRDNNGNEFGIALAGSEWAIFCSDPGVTYSKFSIGKPNAFGSLEVGFQQLEFIPKKHFIPVEKAVDAARVWFDTGELSKAVEWECQRLI